MEKRSKTFCLLLAAAVMGLFLAGCGSEKEPQVIGEKPGNSQESTAEPGAAGERAGENEFTDEGGVRDQVQAPERWQAEVEEDEMIVLADAPVTVPNVRQIGEMKSEAVNFTEEEYERVKDVIAKEVNLSWEPDRLGTEEDRAGWKTIAEDGRGANGMDYRISYRIALEENMPGSSLIWVTRRIAEGRSSTQRDILYDTDQEEAVSRSAKAEELEKKAEELLGAAGFDNYQQYRGVWRKNFYRTSGEDQDEMEYQIVYTPVTGGVGCARNEVNLFGNFYLYGPYIEVFYHEDGTLNRLKIIDKEAVKESAGTEHFLLPFDAVHELFVQYCRDFFRNGGGAAADADAAEARTPAMQTDSRPVVTVKYVRLEYVFVQEKGHQPVNELEVIPAWNFYGSIKNGHVSQEDGTVKTKDYWTARQEPEGLILSIRADDGQILVD